MITSKTNISVYYHCTLCQIVVYRAIIQSDSGKREEVGKEKYIIYVYVYVYVSIKQGKKYGDRLPEVQQGGAGAATNEEGSRGG